MLYQHFIYNVKAPGWLVALTLGYTQILSFPICQPNQSLPKYHWFVCPLPFAIIHPVKRTFDRFLLRNVCSSVLCSHLFRFHHHSFDGLYGTGIFDLWRVHWSASPSVSPKQWVHKTFIEWLMKIYACYSRNKPCLVAGTFCALQCLKKGLGYCGIVLEQWFNKSPQSHQPIYIYITIENSFGDMISPI